MKNISVYKLAILGLACCLCACNDFLDEYSQDLTRVQTVQDLDELLVGDCTLPLGLVTYSSYVLSTKNHNFDILHFMSDELQENISTSFAPYWADHTCPTYFPYFTWQRDCFLDSQGKNSLESNESQYWQLAYEKIGRCNAVLEAADELTPMNEEDALLKKHVVGELHFLRANYYFMLVNLYAEPYVLDKAAQTPGIPIKTSAKIEDKEFARNSVAEVYNLIQSDLDKAEEGLSDVATPHNKFRAGITAVCLFRSKVYAFMQQWDETARYARLVLERNSALEDLREWESGFPISDKNAEVIYSNGATCLGRTLFYQPGTANSRTMIQSPIYSISDHLLGLFDDKDGRKQAYITDKDDVSNHCWSYHKIDCSQAGANRYQTASDVFCLRTAEAYLLLAEAETQMGNFAEACRLLNVLRSKRISEVEDVNLTGSELMNIIREERERELCLEGHRWFDLRRYQVDAHYPYTTTIEHTYSVIEKNTSSQSVRTQINYYRLNPHEGGYTLNIPKVVRDFQPSIGHNEREERLPYQSTSE